MFPEQKTKSSKLALTQLILAVVVLISFSVVLGVAGYLAKNKLVANLEPIVSPKKNETDDVALNFYIEKGPSTLKGNYTGYTDKLFLKNIYVKTLSKT